MRRAPSPHARRTLALCGAVVALAAAPRAAFAQQAPVVAAPVASSAPAPALEPARPFVRVTELLDPSTPPIPRPERPREAPRVGPWVLMGLGGGSLLSSLVLFVLRNQAMTGCGYEGGVLTCETRADLDRASTAPTFEAATWGTATAGFVSVTGGFIWWFARRAPPPVTTAFAPLTGGGGAVVVGGRF